MEDRPNGCPLPKAPQMELYCPMAHQPKLDFYLSLLCCDCHATKEVKS
jgi:hypothetical protein